MMRAPAEYEGMRNAIFGFACAICSHLGAFSSENSINEQTVDFTGFADFSAEKNYQRGMWITLWILWINRLLAFPEMWKLWISLWKNSEQLWNTWEFPVEGVCKSDY